jgi:MFS family permease
VTKNRLRHHPWIRALLRDPLILPFYLPSLAIHLGHGLLSPILPLYAEGFGVSYAWVGAATSAEALGMLLTDLPCGLLLRRLGQKRAMLVGLVLLILTRTAIFWAGSIHQVFAYRLISGFGMALFSVARHDYISEHATVATRGRAMALFGGMMRVGMFVGPLAGGFIASGMGLRVPFLVSALVTFPAILFVIWFVAGQKDAPRKPQATAHSGHILPRPAHTGKSFWSMLREQSGVLIPAGLGQIFAQMIRSGRNTIIPLYAANVLGLDVGEVGLMLGIAAAVEMVMFLPAGWLMDGLGRKYSIVPSFTIQAVGMALVPLTGGFAGLVACSSIIGAGNGLSSGAMLTLGSDYAPEDARGEFLGVWRLIGDIGGTGGPAAVGIVGDLLALPAAALTLATASLLAALIFGLLLPETLQREPAVAARSS